MANNLCCVLNMAFACSYCDWRVCRECHRLSGDAFAHSHSLSLFAGSFHSVPFFCPVSQKLLADEGGGELGESTLYDSSGRLQQQIDYLGSIKNKDAPRNLVQT